MGELVSFRSGQYCPDFCSKKRAILALLISVSVACLFRKCGFRLSERGVCPDKREEDFGE